MPSKGAEWRPRSRRWRPRSRRINALLSSMRPETSLLGVTAVRGGGGASLRAQDRGLGHGLGGLFTTLNTQAKFYFNSSFYTSTTAGTRPGCRVTATTTCSAASPALEDIKTIIVIRIIHVMFLKIASWVAGNVMTLFRSAPGSKSAISPDISPVFVSVSIVNSRPMLAPVSVVRCRLQTRAEHLVSKTLFYL